MKEKFIEFLFKRMGTKLEHIGDSVDADEMAAHMDDMAEYLQAAHDLVKDIIKESILP